MKSLTLIKTCTLIFLIAGLSSCAPKEEQRNLPKHVILIGFDGWSAYAMNNGARMPTVRRLMNEGAYTLQNRSVLPSSSACNWASMFSGASPELHGYTTWGSTVPDLLPRVLDEHDRFPDIFSLLRKTRPEAEIGYIYEWGGIKYVTDSLAMSFSQQVPMNAENPDGCTPVAVKYIKEKKPDFLAVIYDQPDGTGHKSGWESQEYLDKLDHLDSCLAQIIQAVEDAGMMDETVLVIVSDHGGIGNNHGGKTMNEMQTPLTFYGKGIKKGHQITESTMIYDIAGTLATLLNVEQPQAWIARPIETIFE